MLVEICALGIIVVGGVVFALQAHTQKKVGGTGLGVSSQIAYDHSETHGVYDCSPQCDRPDGQLAYGYAIADAQLGGFDVPTNFPTATYPYKIEWSATLPNGVLQAHKIGTVYLNVYKDAQNSLSYATVTPTTFGASAPSTMQLSQ